MRRRWKVEADFLCAFGMLQFVGGAIVFLVVCAATNPCYAGECGLNSNRFSVAAWITLACWAAPWLLAGLVGAAFVARCLWAIRPRRVTEPVLTDLRESQD